MAPMTFRNPPWAGFIALVLLGLGAVTLSGMLPEPDRTAPQSDSSSLVEGLAWAGDGPWLLPGRPFTGVLSGGHFHAFKVFIEADQAVELVVEQQGIDVLVTLWSPDRRRLLFADNPGGVKGEERLFAVAASSGPHVLIVHAANEEDPAGNYRARVLAVRPATQEDRLSAEAARLFSEAEWRLNRTPRYGSALVLYRRALSLWESLRDHDAIIETQHRIAATHAALSSPEDRSTALSIWQDEVLPAWQGTPREPFLLNQIGEASFDVELLRRALESAHRWDDRAQEMRALNQMIPLLQRQGQIQRALSLLESALRLPGASLRERARLYATAGELYRTAGNYEKSVHFCRNALDLLAEAEGQPVALAAKNTLALALFPLGEHEEALDVLSEAWHLAQQTGGPEWMASVLNSLGTVHVDRYERASPETRNPADLGYADLYLTRALRLARQVRSGYQEANALAYLGRTRDLQGREEEGIELCTRAKEKYRDLQYEFGVAGTSFCLARVYQDSGRIAEAQSTMEKSLEIIEGLRSDPLSSNLRAKFMGARRRFYQFSTSLLMELAERHPGQDFEVAALELSERFRGRTLLEELAARARVTSGSDDAVAKERRILEEELRQAAPELRLLSDASPSRTLSEQAKIRDLIVRLESLGSGAAAALTPREAPKLLTLAEIQSQVVDEGTLFLEYLLGEERSFLWLVGKDFVDVRVLPREEEISDLAAQFAELAADARDADGVALAQTVGQELVAILLEPVADRLGTHRLLISPDGVLGRVPFEALPAPRSCPAARGWKGSGVPPLFVCNEVVYTPSASVLAEIRDTAARRPAPQKRLAALGDPVFGLADPRVRRAGAGAPTAGSVGRSLHAIGLGGLDRLAESGKEVEEIAKVLPSNQVLVATGFEATRELAMSSDLAQYGIVHFATHALVRSDFPELSGLVFSQLDRRGRWQDGFLPLYEVYNLNLPVDLVVLSACRTAKGQEVRGEGVIGLARAFLSAGASRVIVSLWDVDDEATSALMQSFYENVFERRLSYSAALREARLAMLNDPEHPEWAAPYYWAPFVLQGEWR